LFTACSFFQKIFHIAGISKFLRKLHLGFIFRDSHTVLSGAAF
jgi:hypothetical protein